jgi:hypothetical protein
MSDRPLKASLLIALCGKGVLRNVGLQHRGISIEYSANMKQFELHHIPRERASLVREDVIDLPKLLDD